MLSRVADNLFWLNRYLERAENYARFIDVNYNLALELHPDVETQWRPLVQATGDLPQYRELYPEMAKAHVLHFLGFDERNPNSVYSSVVKARENARAVRSEITREIWEQTNALYYYVREARERERWRETDPRDYFVDVRRDCQRLWGLYDSTISQSEGWHFSRIGRLLERADKTTRILDIKYLLLRAREEEVGSTFDLIQWSALLKSVSAYDMYKRRHGKLTSRRIAEFLIFDKRFPRSVHSCVHALDESLQAVSADGVARDRLSPAQRQLGQLNAKLTYADIDEVLEGGMHDFLEELQRRLNGLSASLFDTFFSLERGAAGREARSGGMSQSQG